MTDKKNAFWIILGIVLLFALIQQNKIATQQFSVMDKLVPSGTGLEKMVFFWIGIGVIALLLIQSFWWSKK